MMPDLPWTVLLLLFAVVAALWIVVKSLRMPGNHGAQADKREAMRRKQVEAEHDDSTAQ
jgi:hypothetical protein